MTSAKQHIIDTNTSLTDSAPQHLSVVCRGSWLSLAQAQIFKQKVAVKFPAVTINIIIKETEGDKNQSTPLHLVEGKNFFTKDIQDILQKGEADFAVHSMKDVSGAEFFKQNHYAIIDREDIRDVAIFNPDIIEKLKAGKKIVIGTSSPRRSNMANIFLARALPLFKNETTAIEVIAIRGNVDIRLQKLSAGDKYDGVILAAAGLNRLLKYEASANSIIKLLSDKKIMVLPLFECPPAAGQGAIVAETTAANKTAIKILDAVRDQHFHYAIQQERKIAAKYGYGCSQQFGAFHIDNGAVAFTYAAGKDSGNNSFTQWHFNALSEKVNGSLFSSADYMKDFFSYSFLENVKIDENVDTVFIASHKAIHSADLVKQVLKKRVWAAGTKTWLQLARQGIWVEGSADGLGWEFAQKTLQSALVNLHPNSVQIITNTYSSTQWQKEGTLAIGTYQLVPALSIKVQKKIAEADIIFWTSYQQYQLCKNLFKASVKHCCLSGKTATLLQEQHISPLIFPGIKAFNEWKIKHTIAIAGE